MKEREYDKFDFWVDTVLLGVCLTATGLAIYGLCMFPCHGVGW